MENKNENKPEPLPAKICDLCSEPITGEPVSARLPMPGFEFDDCQGNTYVGEVCEECANYIEDNGYNL